MALIKELVLDSGITVYYHRVVSVMNVTNQASIIEVASYTSKAKREEEIAAIIANEPMDVFIQPDYISLPYDAILDVDGAYVYLKTLDKYLDFTNDLDE